MPTLGCSAVVFHDEEVLLIKRRDVPIWALPGGGVESNESCAEAAVREVREETGVHIELTRLVGIYSRPRWRSGGDHATVFAARAVTTDLVPQEEEVSDVGFFPIDNLPEPFVWWHRQRLVDAHQGVIGVCRQQDVVWPYEEGETGFQQMLAAATSGTNVVSLFAPGPNSERIDTEGGTVDPHR
jgi:ADP-ribose pyrophosphatase YjhB (NUDIX family)